MRTYSVYMLFCRDRTYYTGVTNDLDRRVAEHELGLNPECYTFRRRPLILVYSTSHDDILEAIVCEKKLKGWTHAKKSALIQGDWNTVKALSKRASHARARDRPLRALIAKVLEVQTPSAR